MAQVILLSPEPQTPAMLELPGAQNIFVQAIAAGRPWIFSKRHVLESVRGRYRSFWKSVSDIFGSPAFTFSKAYHFLEAKITTHFAAEVCIFVSLRKACRPGLPQRRLPSPGRQLSEADLSFYRRPHKSECISRNRCFIEEKRYFSEWLLCDSAFG